MVGHWTKNAPVLLKGHPKEICVFNFNVAMVIFIVESVLIKLFNNMVPVGERGPHCAVPFRTSSGMKEEGRKIPHPRVAPTKG